MTRIVSVFFIFLFLGGCAAKNDNFVNRVFQTNGASRMVDFRLQLDSLLLKLSKKLIKRNQEMFSKDIVVYLQNEIVNQSDDIVLPLVKDGDFREYLKIAFLKKRVKDQGDYLLVGLYKMFFWSFEGSSHKLSALQYDGKKLLEAYKILQAIAWKIKVAKDNKGEYLYLTWQNNWQVELQKRLHRGEKLSLKLINSLKYIKNKKESLLSSSNLSFEKIFGKMMLIYEMALKTVGIEPKSLGADALRGIFLML